VKSGWAACSSSTPASPGPARVQELRPIRLKEDSGLNASEWLDEHDRDARDRIDALLRLVDGFETPYNLELLATVHFAARQELSADAGRLVEMVRDWSGRKARLFTEEHIGVACDRLRDEGMLASAYRAL